MSPFLSDGIIKTFNDRNKYIEHSEYVLITRASELGKLKQEDCSNFDIYTMKDAIVDGEGLISDENTEIRKQDIHAKIYMFRKNSDSYLYLGSLNASHNALYGNIEFMIKLHSKNRYLNLTKMQESLFGTDEAESPFQIADLNNKQIDEIEAKTNALDSFIKDINRLSPSAVIRENGELYDICVAFEPIEAEYKITISPLLSNKSSPLSENGNFYLRGAIIHKLLQFLPQNNENKESLIEEYLEKNAEDLSIFQKKQIKTEVLNLLNNVEFAENFGKNSKPEVPIMGEVDGKIVSAQLDRLVVLPDKVLIVDFKTNRPAAQTLENTPATYINQLSMYAKLLNKIYQGKRVETYILWTNEARLMRVS